MDTGMLTAAIEKTLRRITREAGLVGGAVSVVRGGEVVYTYNYGYADRENQIPFTQETLCDVASTSKAWTVMLAAKAIDDGLIAGWDTPIKQYIPEFEMYDKYAGEHLSIRDMASHRTGLPGHDMLRDKICGDRETIMRKTALLEPNAGFRSGYQYNNHFFILLGYLLERVRAEKWEDQITRYISDPLGVDQIRFRGIAGDLDRVTAALPYGANGFVSRRCPYFTNYHSAPCGGIRINMRNMSKWVIAMARGGVTENGVRLCSEQQYKEMITPVIPTPGEDYFCMKNAGYAQGWINGNYRGTTVLYHSGGHTGFNTMVGFVPGQDCGFAMSFNTGSTPAHRIVRAIVLDYLITGTVRDSYDDMIDAWCADRDAMRVKMECYENAAAATADSHPGLAGIYRHPAYETFEIAAGEDGKLVFRYGDLTAELRVRQDGSICGYTGVLDGLTPVGIELHPRADGSLGMEHPDNYGLVLEFAREN